MENSVRKRKYFTQEKRQLIVQEHFSSGLPIAVLARKYGIHAITLYAWKRQMNQKKDLSEIDPEFIRNLIDENDRLKSEVHALKAKVGDLAVRNDISPESNGMAEAFVKTIKRDYVYQADCFDAESASFQRQL